ncbi:hypothetical protein ACJX0J_024567, partial [Zea mays]
EIPPFDKNLADCEAGIMVDWELAYEREASVFYAQNRIYESLLQMKNQLCSLKKKGFPTITRHGVQHFFDKIEPSNFYSSTIRGKLIKLYIIKRNVQNVKMIGTLIAKIFVQNITHKSGHGDMILARGGIAIFPTAPLFF